jgi:hypothetical protein
VYLRAIESGLKPDTIIRDEPPLTLETAFAVSDNDATVRLAQRLGLESVAGTAPVPVDRRTGVPHCAIAIIERDTQTMMGRPLLSEEAIKPVS